MAHLESGHRGFCLVSLLGTERIVIANREKKFYPPAKKKKTQNRRSLLLRSQNHSASDLDGSEEG